jgi:hypothetical protein
VRTRISTAEHRVSKQPGLCRGFSISAWRTRKRFTTSSVLLPGA